MFSVRIATGVYRFGALNVAGKETQETLHITTITPAPPIVVKAENNNDYKIMLDSMVAKLIAINLKGMAETIPVCGRTGINGEAIIEGINIFELFNAHIFNGNLRVVGKANGIALVVESEHFHSIKDNQTGFVELDFGAAMILATNLRAAADIVEGESK